jgi:hypothetical protein
VQAVEVPAQAQPAKVVPPPVRLRESLAPRVPVQRRAESRGAAAQLQVLLPGAAQLPQELAEAVRAGVAAPRRRAQAEAPRRREVMEAPRAAAQPQAGNGEPAQVAPAGARAGRALAVLRRYPQRTDRDRRGHRGTF